MSVALSLLALAFLGTDGPQAPGAPQITFQMAIVEMKGVDWRESVYAQLQPVTRQRGATVWTAGAGAAAALKRRADSVTQAPRLTSFTEAPAHVSFNPPPPDGGCTFEWRSRVSRNHGTVRRVKFEAPAPAGKGLRPSFAATFTGRKLDQGVLTKFVLEETRFLAVHTTTVVERQDARDVDGTIKVGMKPVQVPEVAQSDVIGEWLIPNDGALVISLGAHTVAGDKGQAEVRERLVVLEASEAAAPPTTAALPPLADRLTTSMGIAPGRVVPQGASVPMPVPTPPSRSLPQPIKADGTPGELPPLPPEAATPTTLPDSSEPCASPQARPAPKPKPAGATPPPMPPLPSAEKVDPDSAKTSLAPPPPVRGAELPDPIDRALSLIVRLAGAAHDLPALPDLPQGKYIHDDVQYFPPGPNFPWANTQAATQRARMQAMGFEPPKPEGPCAARPASATARPLTFRFPWDGTTVEIRVTPGPGAPGACCPGECEGSGGTDCPR